MYHLRNLFLLFTLFSFNLEAADFKVYPNAFLPDYSSIQDAVDAAEDGDVIYIDTLTFLGNVSISNKSISLYPMRDDGMFTINGSLSITLETNETVYIQGLSGGSLSVYKFGSNLTNRNLILNGCLFTGTVSVAKYIMSHFYYSTFERSLSLFEAELIANKIEGNVSLNRSDDKVDFEYKIYANFIFLGTNENINCQSLSDIHIANNYYFKTISVSSSPFITVNSDDGESEREVLIENNFFKFSNNQFSSSASSYSYYTSDSYGMFYFRNLDFLTLRNNYFYSSENTYAYASSQYKDIFTQNISMYNFSNNIINADGQFDFGSGTIQTIENNMSGTDVIYSDDFATAGIISSHFNTGSDLPECRDIDNTVNDVGTYGGPHSWLNYHSTSSDSKAQILDLEIPYYQVILPGVELQFNSKAIHKN